jgi:hypothetical protein
MRDTILRTKRRTPPTRRAEQRIEAARRAAKPKAAKLHDPLEMGE